MINLYINNKSYRVLNSFSHSLSINQVDFSNITLDFSDKTFEDVPLKYQECILKENDEIIFIGYVDSIDLRKIAQFKELEITLLSPFKMATIRTSTVIGTYKTKQAIEMAIAPLIIDGFYFVEENYFNGEITLSYSLETVERIMNKICNKKGLAWYIDKNKGIHINSIDYMYAKSAIFELNEDSDKTGIVSITPKIQSIDYANVLNFKNVKLIGASDKIISNPITMQLNDTVNFNYPVIIDEKYTRRQLAEINKTEYSSDFFHAIGIYGQSIGINLITDKWEVSDKIGFSDDNDVTNKSIILIRDNFYKNLIVGFRWNDSSLKPTIYSVISETALKDVSFKYFNNAEIEKMKGILSNSGQVEKIIDYMGKWTNTVELVENATSIMSRNGNEVSNVEILIDTKNNAQIGDLVRINLPEFLINGNFIISKIKNIYYNKNRQETILSLTKGNLLYNYIDIFRAADGENSITTIENAVVSYYVEEELKINTDVEEVIG